MANTIPAPRKDRKSGDAVKGALAVAEELCRAHGVKLTPARRLILEILAREGRPLGAYEMIEKVAVATGKRPAPVSIYRALDFLLENGLVHRLASRNAYLACGHSHEMKDVVVFLICENCGTVIEATSDALRKDLAALAANTRFVPHSQVMEIAGRCRACGES
ncbi:MAG TPA: Fur family transcriptional regulator [Methylovirgula sp.]